MSYVIGVDIGGTFTDCVAVDDEGALTQAKVLSTHATDPADGAVDALERLATSMGLGLDELLADTARLGHGTTIGTNLLVERRGARVALVTTAGHGDAVLMMRGAGRTAGVPIDQVYSVHHTRKPDPLVERRHVAEVHERVAADGTVVAPLDIERARGTLSELLDDGDEEIKGVAIALLWSFTNPEHEQRLRSLIAELRPDMYVSCSSDIAPRRGEYERMVATLINSYVGPASTRFIEGLERELHDHGLRPSLDVMQANGGTQPAAAARDLPISLIGSGPAGGISGVAKLAALAGHRNVIATDMGGTSFEVGLIIDGQPVVATQRVVGQHTFHQTHLDARSIACGGGSIASFDAHANAIRVGPTSAGSDPGPACYGRGGERPTVTDADVVLGLLRPEAFLGGGMRLDEAAAWRAVASVAEPLGLSVEVAAAGIVRINSHAAATLIRQRTLEQGLDPRDFTLYAYGGAGPLHAFAYGAELGVAEVMIPLGNGASTLSAYGIAAGDALHHFEREVVIHAPFDADALADVVATLEQRAREVLTGHGARGDEIVLGRTALMRYAGQYLNEVPVGMLAGTVDDQACAALADGFDAEYTRLHGPGARAVFQAVEIFCVRVEARVPHTTRGSGPPRDGAPERGEPADPSGEREVLWPSAVERCATAIYDGSKLVPGQQLAGPAIVELAHTTVAVAPGQQLRSDAEGRGMTLRLGREEFT